MYEYKYKCYRCGKKLRLLDLADRRPQGYLCTSCYEEIELFKSKTFRYDER